MTLMSGIRATGATVVPFSVGTGLPSGTTLAVDIRTDAGPWAHLTGVAVTAQGQFSIADSNFATGESNFVRVKREDQPDAAYSQPIALVVDPSVTSSSASTINHISISRLGTDLKLRWSLAANNNKPFKILFRRADTNTELDLTPMGLPANSRELSLGSQSQNLPAGNFLAHQVLGTIDQGGLGGHFEDGTIPPPTATGPVYIVQYHHRDHLGTLRLITDEMGGLIEAHDFEPFGVELNPPFGAASRKKYTGHERDESTGLDYMLARYHSPALGRFLSVDPGRDIQPEDPQSRNLYGYVRNNPINGTDPTGMWDASMHVGINAVVFRNLSAEQRKILNDVGAYMDRVPAGQTKARAHDHAMRSPNEDAAAARQAIETQIQTKIAQAGVAQGKEFPKTLADIKPAALKIAAEAVHTAEDRACVGPNAHTGPEGNPNPWPGNNPVSGIVWSHSDTGNTVNAQAAALAVFTRAFGPEIAKQLTAPPKAKEPPK